MIGRVSIKLGPSGTDSNRVQSTHLYALLRLIVLVVFFQLLDNAAR